MLWSMEFSILRFIFGLRLYLDMTLIGRLRCELISVALASLVDSKVHLLFTLVWKEILTSMLKTSCTHRLCYSPQGKVGSFLTCHTFYSKILALFYNFILPFIEAVIKFTYKDIVTRQTATWHSPNCSPNNANFKLQCSLNRLVKKQKDL